MRSPGRAIRARSGVPSWFLCVDLLEARVVDGGFVPVRDMMLKEGSSVEKGIRWMPWRVEAMKDVARCDKLRGAASRL